VSRALCTKKQRRDHSAAVLLKIDPAPHFPLHRYSICPHVWLRIGHTRTKSIRDPNPKGSAGLGPVRSPRRTQYVAARTTNAHIVGTDDFAFAKIPRHYQG
jgi:hypothetical protein